MDILQKLINNFNLNNLKDFANEYFDINTRDFGSDFVYTLNNSVPSENITFVGKVEKDYFDFGFFAIKVNGLRTKPQKKDQYNIAKDLLKNNFLNYGIFVFYTKEGDDFRLSLVTCDYEENPNYTGFNKRFNAIYSNYKRYTYYVKAKAPNNTFVKQMAKIYGNATIENIKEAFSVEVVTKEFYTEIQNLFDEIKDKDAKILVYKGSDSDNFIIRLLSRILFCWFMKEKHSLQNTPLIPGELLSIDTVKNTSEYLYYNAVLQTLFFNVLNEEMNKRDYTLFDSANLFLDKSLFDTIPYLNGGLFQDETGDKYERNFSNIGTIKIKNQWFIDLFELFSRYNFTIDENTVSDSEISVDPEMLGRIFENLLAYIDPDTNQSARNATGSFYTPREIVDYMCKSSLKEYLLDYLKKCYEPLCNEIKENKKPDDGFCMWMVKNGKITCFHKEYSVITLGFSDDDPEDPIEYDHNYQIQKFAELLDEKKIDKQDIFNIVSENKNIKSIDDVTVEYLRDYVIPNYMKTIGKDLIDPIPELVFEDSKKDLKKEEEAIPLAEAINRLFDDNQENPFGEELSKKIVEALYKIKILDPACGSGAFPMGMLQIIVNVLEKLDPTGNLWIDYIFDTDNETLEDAFKTKLRKEDISYIHKIGIIRNSIYGVDIQPMATEISRLRCFLSLIVDENVDDREENKNIFPLPNLEFKFVSANTLVKLEEATGLFDFDNYVDDLSKIIEQYLNSHGANKESKKQEYKSKKDDLSIEAFSSGNLSDRVNQIISWDPFTNESNSWFDPKWMFCIKDGFDIVIGNPPYIQLQSMDNDIKSTYRAQDFDVYDSMGDIYCLFYEKGIDLLKDGGLLCYITSNKWMRAGYGVNLREYFCRFNPKILIDLGPGVFESATVDTNILLIKKEKAKKHNLDACSVKVGRGQNPKDNLGEYIKNNSVVLNQLSSDSWFIGTKEEISLKEKIERVGTPLGEWDDITINYGIKTGYNEAFIIDTQKREEILNNCATRDERERTEAIIKPILRGRDIKRYEYNWADLWVIGTFPALHLDIKDYPAIKKYFLDNFDKRRLEQTGKNYGSFKARKRTSNDWFETQDQIGYYQDFEKEKIVWTPVNSEYRFCYLESGWYFNNSLFMIVSKNKNLNVKYLLGIFNCKIIIKYLNMILDEDNYTYGSKDAFNKIPIPKITDDNRQIANQIENLVDQITEGKKQGKDTTSLENQIDNLVYQLYNLTPDEIAIIEKE